MPPTPAAGGQDTAALSNGVEAGQIGSTTVSGSQANPDMDRSHSNPPAARYLHAKDAWITAKPLFCFDSRVEARSDSGPSLDSRRKLIGNAHLG